MSSPRAVHRGGGRSRGGRGGSGRGAHRSDGPAGPSAAPSAPLDRAPRGICDFYWSTGACRRSFDCTYRHEAKPEATTAAAVTSVAESSPDFFSTEGLASNNGSVLAAHARFTPNEAHNHIKSFLHDNYVFNGPPRMEGFSRIFASINDRNKSWAFLDMIVHGNALIRVGDVLRFTPVAVDAGTGVTSLSFQRGFFPILEYMASDLVLKSTMHENINALYTLIERNYSTIHATTRTCLQSMVDARTWDDKTRGLPASRQNTLDGVIVFKTLTTILAQFFTRFKQAIRNHPEIQIFVDDLHSWFEDWSKGVGSDIPTFKDPITSSTITVRNLTLEHIRQDIVRLKTIVDREFGIAERLRRPAPKAKVTAAERQQALVTRLAQTYDPPGTLREGQTPRHDNDFANISTIRIAPTHQELMAPISPYLPVFSPEAPHHLPARSMERHLDIQFRLLREEMISSIRQALLVLHRDLDIMWEPRARNRPRTKLEEVLRKGGGAYKTSGLNSVFFHLYTNARFAPVRAERRNFTIGLLVDSPPTGAARDPSAKKRGEYWEHSKRLQHGSLVALVLVSPGRSHIYLGTIVSSGGDIAESAKANQDEIQLRISFFDAELELMALRREPISLNNTKFAILVDNNVMFEAVRPFLETLQTVEPTSIPFSRYIAHGDQWQDMAILPPRYTRAPGFKFKLQCLASPGHTIRSLDVQDIRSVDTARRELLRSSQLDPSQVDAVIDALCRELVLIQGYSFTGKELLRVLFASNIRPIVLIAYTNHALDHMLTSVLDAKITSNIVRLGSRSTDERIAQYSLHNLEKTQGRAGLDRTLGRQYAQMKQIEEEMARIMISIQLPRVSLDELMRFLEIHYLEQAVSLTDPPFWINKLHELAAEDEAKNGEWIEAPSSKQKKQKSEEDAEVSTGIYGFWKRGQDIEFLHTPSPESATIQDPRLLFFGSLGFGGAIPPVPSLLRDIDSLMHVDNLWSMSKDERHLLSSFWEEEIRTMAYHTNLAEFEQARDRYKHACKLYKDVEDEARRRLLSKTDLIGCTTTGAAKLISLLTSIGPRVVMVEEAGQVLESHILASLVPSVEHLISIGDPKQLRPTLDTFSLSMDSASGAQLYKFDRSLMERLADSGMPMSQINVQRRMRPTISHHIRNILYPKLDDHNVVRDYPPVMGMEKDVFFFTHDHQENAEADSVSKFNLFEVNIIRDLVMYFLKQGPYNEAGDIAVLCAYFGQLQKVRAALKDLKIAVSVDERDEDQLERKGLTGEDEVGFDQVLVSKHIRLGTVDTFQGEEAKIVIVSLVRNSGAFEEGQTIGFLKSENRVNVALSRAKHGLYILGNASNLRKNATWTKVLDGMEELEQIGYGFPIVCPRHPETRNIITEPGQLAVRAPEGGCLAPCNARLPCGHTCPSVCHADLDNHRRMPCDQACTRVPCPRGHPCPRRCCEDCGDCQFPFYDVELPCGHRAKTIPCHRLETLREVKCTEKISKRLPGCEHTALVSCHQDPGLVLCQEVCRGVMTCCSRTCNTRCHECQTITHSAQPAGVNVQGRQNRSHHRSHACERLLKCQHQCGLDCSPDHECNGKCAQTCRQRCAHHKCAKHCWVPCPPCMEPCEWSCVHQSCPVLCGSICSRLPCDVPCRRILPCGHPCPSVCGEPCASQICVSCLPQDRRSDIVDFILQRSLEDIDLSLEDVSERLISLECGHTFTMETLDGHCGMANYYEIDPLGNFLGTKAPPTSYQTPPSCPTCRGPISALRYGRVTKRATLDILEQNVASTMSAALDKVSSEIEALTVGLKKAQDDAKTLAYKSPFKLEDEFNRLLVLRENKYGKEDAPLPAQSIMQSGMTTIHGLAAEEARNWIAIVRDLLQIYKKVVDVAKTRGPHVRAYEAALSTLYRLELDAIASDPARACDAPEPLAMSEVNKKIGQPPHKADTRFQVEAFFVSLELRYLLAVIGKSRIEGLPGTSNDSDVLHHKQIWRSFVKFLFESCVRDARKSFVIATKSSASRLAARASMHNLRAELEQFRFSTLCDRDDLAAKGRLDAEFRQKLAKGVTELKTHHEEYLKKAMATYLRNRPTATMQELKEERQWFTKNCHDKASKYLEEYDNLKEHILTDSGYTPLSLQEREDIVKAFGFTHRGHFYNCQNGHTFVITECGGAMQAATCPECRAPIGGSHHTLNASNTRATEFEEIAGRQGSEAAPWPWARGA
ncbi:hypothetical protein BV25DRAFT_1872764 [Artomyces pyxidatus]|uniref:Uncharacterized protein n=1 Tax=Artomyces pyxidatus TaxID=48021 RepID=A0ACB8SKP9_9AGAM|nr:hypothetical protein BV25DRAFT_1872764 [Artomyces pyxidatus]